MGPPGRRATASVSVTVTRTLPIVTGPAQIGARGLARNGPLAHLSSECGQAIDHGQGRRMTVEALRRRRPETLGDLLSAYGHELQAVAFLILRDRSEAEDVVIETLLTAFERGGQIRDERALRAWLLRVATNKALGTRRGRSGSSASTVRPTTPARAISAIGVDDAARPARRASTAFRSRCGRRSCSATTPTCRSRTWRPRSARAPTPSRPSSRPRSIGCGIHLIDPSAPSLTEAHHA